MREVNDIRIGPDEGGGTHSPHTPFVQILIYVKEHIRKIQLTQLVNYLIFPRKLSNAWGPPFS
jgi:hypothetical protein